MVKSYFIFVYNVTKRYVDNLHFMDLYILYMTICVALKENSNEVKLKIQNMVYHNRFFIFFDKINFYEYI